ncbi:EamA-like transporter family protein [Methanococcoides vulcani]|uniref:EamA-like transporter family protein n=1 Tax=Methanococcoides vulcani TaxID=1353158 RepID=A0A1I0ASD7_9EURY|nr:DMT family transporter [Methanococcoides vulcani]SES96673.1 EamA-like transporter family protein [Methanococcoides vulcani]
MISPEILVIFFSLAAAATWGAADFGGGFATKRASVYSVVIITQAVGLVLLPFLALYFSEEFPPMNGMFWGFVAGVAGSLGLLALYHALSMGKMGVVAPISAVVTVALPVVYGAFNEGLPAGHQIAGFVMAIAAMWLISSTGEKGEIKKQDVVYPLLAGVGFGIFFISVDLFSESAVFWPLTVAKLSAVVVILGFALLRRSATVPSKGVLPLIILAGLFDTGGNLFFALASQVGRLDIATVIASLYPGSTVLLAWIILKERLSSMQWIGVVLALAAIALISL